MKPLNVLLSAYSCNPKKGSEPGTGWNVARELAKYHQIWVLTRKVESVDIEAELAKNPVSGLHFIYFDLPSWVSWLLRGKVHLYYYLWQIGAYFAVQKNYKGTVFDLVHHITFGNHWMPSFLVFLPVPFIWGPVEGEYAPKSFWRDFSLYSKFYETLREAALWIGKQDLFVRQTAKRSVLALAPTLETRKRLQKLGAKNVQAFSQTGLKTSEIEELGQLSVEHSECVRFLSIGRFFHFRGFHLGLQAFAQANIAGAEYWIIGDGPEGKRLENLANNLGIMNQVRFWGRLPRPQVLQKLAECHVLVHPSLHNSEGWVCLEAMAAGRPVICLDLGGVTTQVTAETGWIIPGEEPTKVVKDLAQGMLKLAQNSDLRLQMGEAGRQRVKSEFSWEVKGKRLNAIYQDVRRCGSNRAETNDKARKQPEQAL